MISANLVADKRFCTRTFIVEGPAAKLFEVTAWLEDNEDCPSLQCRYGQSHLGMTMGNWSARSEIDNLVILTREFYKVMRQTCGMWQHKEPPYGCPVSEWIGDVLDSLKSGKDMVLERA